MVTEKLEASHQSGLAQIRTTIHTPVHAYGHFTVAACPSLHVFGLWEETGACGGNPRIHMQTPYTKIPVGQQVRTQKLPAMRHTLLKSLAWYPSSFFMQSCRLFSQLWSFTLSIAASWRYPLLSRVVGRFFFFYAVLVAVLYKNTHTCTRVNVRILHNCSWYLNID